jgi:formate hydrogenlyase subunit 4
MNVIFDLLVQGMEMILVLLLAPLLTGLCAQGQARLLRRRGPSLVQPYRDLQRLLRKEVVLATTHPGYPHHPLPGLCHYLGGGRWCRRLPPA